MAMRRPQFTRPRRSISLRLGDAAIFDAGVGTDNLFHKEKLKTDLKVSVLNLTNNAALYNFLSTFSGTHWVTPRALQVTMGWVY